jgi:hypothetical protein
MILEDLRQTVEQTMIKEGDISPVAAAVAKKYPNVTAEQLKASVREAAKGGKRDSEIAQALRAKYKGADFEDLLAGVREATLKGAEHDQLLAAIRQVYAHIRRPGPSNRQTETNRAFSMSQFQPDQQFIERLDRLGVPQMGQQRTEPLRLLLGQASRAPRAIWPRPSCASVTRRWPSRQPRTAP